MKINFLQEESLFTLKGNIKDNVLKYNEKDNSWIIDFFNGQSPFLEFKYDVNDFDLLMNEERPEKTDLENIKRIYLNLKFLTETQATDERLWAGLAHDKFWTYMQYRWPIQKMNEPQVNLKRQYFFGESKRRSLTFHGIAKLWWIGRYTYDDRREDPFELTRYVCKDLSTTSLYLFSSNFTSNDNIRLGMLRAIVDTEKRGYRVKRQEQNQLIKYFNILGGTYILDLFSEDEIYEKAIKKLNKMFSLDEKSA
ncbi:hypothetical protein KPL33_13115 [Clostridium algidicarnis]|uniref:DUF6339 family protein n=1 Tax=Clostridium algidicarnis TaxID=37659 RepID=UPI001C0B6507|nr:hypothetical protein [Clostridium algidicarnis]